MAVASIALLAGTRGGPLAAELGRRLGLEPTAVEDELFPDGERRVRIVGSVRGLEVYLLQPLGAPVGESLLALLFLADAARRGGATRLIALIPYLGYARQDRRSRDGEPLGVRVVADLLATARFDRLAVVDLHSAASEAAFACPVDNLSATPLLAETARPFLGPDTVVVAPDAGAARLARDYGRRLGLPVAGVHKTRTGAREVRSKEVAGNVRGLRPFIVDDMISTGSTIAAACEAVEAAGAREGAVVAAAHGLFAPGSAAVLGSAGLSRLLVTDNVEAVEAPASPPTTVSLAPLLAEVVRRYREGRSVDDLLSGR